MPKTASSRTPESCTLSSSAVVAGRELPGDNLRPPYLPPSARRASWTTSCSSSTLKTRVRATGAARSTFGETRSSSATPVRSAGGFAMTVNSRRTYARVKLSVGTTPWPEAPGSKKRETEPAASACPQAASTHIAAARARRRRRHCLSPRVRGAAWASAARPHAAGLRATRCRARAAAAKQLLMLFPRPYTAGPRHTLQGPASSPRSWYCVAAWFD